MHLMISNRSSVSYIITPLSLPNLLLGLLDVPDNSVYNKKREKGCEGDSLMTTDGDLKAHALGKYALGPLICGWPLRGSFMVVVVTPISGSALCGFNEWTCA